MGRSNDYLSNIKQIKGRGSGHGYGHWKMQRLTALALVFLYVWFIYIVCMFFIKPHNAIMAILYSPISLVMFMITITTSIYHGVLGIKVVCEDYIHNIGLRTAVLIAVYFFSIATVILAVFMLITNFIINI